MNTRAKFICTQKVSMDEGFFICLEAVIGGSEENDSFFKYTPSGHIEMDIVSIAASEQFDVGREFYVDFIPADVTFID